MLESAEARSSGPVDNDPPQPQHQRPKRPRSCSSPLSTTPGSSHLADPAAVLTGDRRTRTRTSVPVPPASRSTAAHPDATSRARHSDAYSHGAAARSPVPPEATDDHNGADDRESRAASSPTAPGAE